MSLTQALAALGAAARLGEHGGRFADGWVYGAPCDFAREQARLLEVPRDDFKELVRTAGQALDPLREAQMELRATPLRHLSVRDVAHQDVVERELLVVFDRRDLEVRDEVTPLQLGETGERILGRWCIP